MKAKKIIVVIIVLIVLVSIVVYIQGNRVIQSAMDLDIVTPNISALADGVYTGNYDLSPVAATVETVVANGRITAIKIIKHRHGLGGPAENIVNDVIEKQSLDVDVVAGATLSSRCILKAIEVSLK